MAAVRQVHRQDRVAGLQQREVDGHVGLRAGVRLDVGVLAAEELLRPLDRERLGDVDILAAAIIALAGIALGVFVRSARSPRLEHRVAREVLGRDELEPLFLRAPSLRIGAAMAGSA